MCFYRTIYSIIAIYNPIYGVTILVFYVVKYGMLFLLMYMNYYGKRFASDALVLSQQKMHLISATKPTDRHVATSYIKLYVYYLSYTKKYKNGRA
jgi:hypothetical protein